MEFLLSRGFCTPYADEGVSALVAVLIIPAFYRRLVMSFVGVSTHALELPGRSSSQKPCILVSRKTTPPHFHVSGGHKALVHDTHFSLPAIQDKLIVDTRVAHRLLMRRNVLG